MDQKSEKYSLGDISGKSSTTVSTDVVQPSNDRHVYTKAEKRVKRKIDRVFLPLIFMIIFIQFLDKAALNFAAVMGILTDAHLSEEQFALLGALFYLGYLIFQLPNHYLMQRFPISKYLGAVLICWGATCACTALCTNFASLAAMRVLLGIFESVGYPCVFMLISLFYRRQEQVFVVSWVFMSNCVAIMVGGLIAYAVQHLHGVHGISAWQYMYFIWGVTTVVVGVVFFIFLPDTPKSRWFSLKEEEDHIVDERLKENGMAADTEFNRAHVFEALKEGRLYAIVVVSLLGTLQTGGVGIYTSQIIKSLGFDSFQSLLLHIPVGALTALMLYGMSLLSQWFNEITFVAMGFTMISLVGMILLAATSSVAGQMAGLMLLNPTVYALMQNCIGSNVKGVTKKAFYTACQTCAYCIGHFAGPLLVESISPRFKGGAMVFIGCNVVELILLVYIRCSIVRDQRARSDKSVASADREINDMTDKEDLTFTYRT
ncbi:major facilitator superfamily domain-containing protein [Gongronella butleri]|nr:major facilitator superfamily domain-containing protein [Gongronella butleri]